MAYIPRRGPRAARRLRRAGRHRSGACRDRTARRGSAGRRPSSARRERGRTARPPCRSRRGPGRRRRGSTRARRGIAPAGRRAARSGPTLSANLEGRRASGPRRQRCRGSRPTPPSPAPRSSPRAGIRAVQGARRGRSGPRSCCACASISTRTRPPRGNCVARFSNGVAWTTVANPVDSGRPSSSGGTARYIRRRIIAAGTADSRPRSEPKSRVMPLSVTA